MKKKLSLLLVIVLLCAAALPAFGENGYEFLKSFFSDAEYGGLGIPFSFNQENLDEKTVTVTYDAQLRILWLYGVNRNGTEEASAWTDVSEADGIIALYKVCSGWETLESLLDSGYALTVFLNLPEPYSDELIENAEEAREFADTVIKLLDN